MVVFIQQKFYRKLFCVTCDEKQLRSRDMLKYDISYFPSIPLSCAIREETYSHQIHVQWRF